jgi:hypothetical protein
VLVEGVISCTASAAKAHGSWGVKVAFTDKLVVVVFVTMDSTQIDLGAVVSVVCVAPPEFCAPNTWVKPLPGVIEGVGQSIAKAPITKSCTSFVLIERLGCVPV